MANSRILLVEGPDDEHVLRHICDNRGIQQPDKVEPQDGAPGLLRAIPRQLEASTGEGDVVGVVIDADTNFDARWESLRNIFLQAGYGDVPPAPDPNGTILEPPDDSPLPRSGVWIMPNNESTGFLEHFLHFLVPQPNALFDHVNASVDSIPDRRFSDNDKPKAVMHTWLAWQENPGRPYGTAITARFLDPYVPQVDVLVAWLDRLFYQSEGTT